MRRGIVVLALCCVCVFGPGCDFLVGLLQPSTTSVRLVNNGDFDVEATLYYDDDQELPRDVLTEIGTRMDLTIAPGETTSFTRDCDALQAIVIDNASLNVVGQVGPEADTNVLRDGDDFGCGDTIVFTFDHGPVLVDFDISVAVQQ